MYVQYSMLNIEAEMHESDRTYKGVLKDLPTPTWYCETNIDKGQARWSEANYYTTLKAYEEQSDHSRDMITIIYELPPEVEQLQ